MITFSYFSSGCVCVTVCVYKVQCCSWPSIHPITPALALFLSAVNQGSKRVVGGRGREREKERKRRKEGKRRGWWRGEGLSPWTDGLLFLNTCGTMFRLSLPSSWSRIRRSVGPRHSFVLHTSLFSTAHTHTRARRGAHVHTTQTSPSFSAHMLKSSPLLSASKTQHPRLLCCCQVLPLADATGESYPSEVGLPRERQAPRYVQPPLMWTQTCEHNLENIIYTVRLCTCLDIYKLR